MLQLYKNTNKNKSKRIENKSNEDKRDVGKEDNVSLNQIENEKEQKKLVNSLVFDEMLNFLLESEEKFDLIMRAARSDGRFIKNWNAD